MHANSKRTSSSSMLGCPLKSWLAHLKTEKVFARPCVTALFLHTEHTVYVFL